MLAGLKVFKFRSRSHIFCNVVCTIVLKVKPLEQQSPTFLAPGTGFMEDNFSLNQGVEGMVSGRFKHITFIVHFITSVPPQIIRFWSLGIPVSRINPRLKFSLYHSFIVQLWVWSLIFLSFFLFFRKMDKDCLEN